MMKNLRYLCTFLLLTVLGLGGVISASADTTYKLEKVTSVESGGLYMFEQGGYVMTTVDKKILQFTTTYNKTGLKGSESYVFTLETATASDKKTQGFKMKNMSLSSNQYIGNSSKTDMSATESNSAAVWAFNFQDDQTVLIQNLNNDNRFLGFNSAKSPTGYKAYATSNTSSNPHAIVVYKLVEESSLPAAGLDYEATSYTATLGESFTTPTLTNPNNLTVSYASTKTDVATVDANTGAVTLVGAGTTTITASFAGNDTYAAGDASYTLTVNRAPLVVNPKNVNSNYFVKVYDVADLEDGDAILIVNEGGKKALSTTQNTNNRGAADVTIGSDAIDAPAVEAQRLILVKEQDNFFFYTGSGYLYAAATDKNYLRTGTDCNKNYEAQVSITDGNATIKFQGENTRNLLKYNSSNNPPLFSCYASGQNDVQIYKEAVKPVAMIGNKGYATLQEAVDAAEEGATIDILDDITLTTVTTSPNNKYNVNVNKSVVINGNNHVITSAEGKRAIVLQGSGNDVTLKNLTIKSNKAEACLWIADNLTCTLDNAVLDGTNGITYNQPLTIGSISEEGRVKLNVTNGSVVKTNDAGTAHYAIIVWHPADITVTDSKLIGWANVYLKSDAEGSTVKIENSEMKSQGQSGTSNNFAMITTEGGSNTIEVKDTKITAAAVDGTYMTLLALGGKDNVVKLLGNTTYETNSKVWGGITYAWSSLMTNTLYLDAQTKVALGEYFDGTHQESVETADETGLYPVNYVPEVLYYWAVQSGYQGGYYRFDEPFENGWLDNGEFIALQKDITLTKNIACQLGEGTSFNFLLGDYNVTKGEYCVSLKTGVTVLTDKQTDIFKAAEAGYKIVESTTEEGYSYTAEQILLTAPIIFHDGGEYENALTVAMTGEGTIMYSLNDGDAQNYTAPVAISETTTVKAWTEQDGVKSDVVEKMFTINKTEKPAINLNDYYSIKGGDGKYVNVAGRKTVTFVDDNTDKAGTVIKVEVENAQVKVLRSQGVDIPSYAEKAMRYVPKMVKLVADKLHAEGSGAILGENGLDAIMAKFDESFDEHLYTEEAGESVRIYGRTPSMQPVVDFYAENKANVDVKLPMLEQFINDAIQKVLQKTGGSGASILVPFSLEMVWEKMGKTLTEPKDEASTARFYEEVLSSETNVWDFAYQTAMIYWSKLKNHEKFAEYKDKLGEYAQYIDKIEYIRPDFKYYLVQKNGKIDFISEGNEDILKNNANAIWTLEPRTDFSVAFNEENVLNDKYYTTLYTDFAYTLPEGVKAYKVTEVSEGGDYGYAVTEEVGSQSIAAQTPVLLVSENAGEQVLQISETGTAVTGTNLLVGPDYLIKTYEIKTAQVESLFDMAKALLGDNAYQNYVAEYEHLMLRNAGTVNNKYFFGLSADDLREVENLRVLGLDNAGENLAFHDIWEKVNANEAFIISEKDPVYLSLVGDVNRDGVVTVADVNALVEIVLGTVTEENNPNDYDFEAAHVNADDDITIADVTALVNIILGK